MFLKALIIFTLSGLALEVLHAETLSVETPSGLNLRILDQQEVDLGPRSIIFNRLETPSLKPQPTPSTALPMRQPSTPTAEELAEIRAWEAKRDVFMFLSCVVYDRKVTEVRWWRADGEYVLWSGIDFNYLQQLFDFETESVRYSLFSETGNENTEDVRQWNAEVDADPELRSYETDLHYPLPPDGFIGASGSRTFYRLVSFPKTGVAPEAQTALDDLHRYYDANREDLVRGYEESEKARLAHEEWLKANPPQPKDTVINFFPIRSSYNEENGGTK